MLQRHTFDALMKAVKDLPFVKQAVFPFTVVQAGDHIIDLDPMTSGELTEAIRDAGYLRLNERGNVSLDGLTFTVRFHNSRWQPKS